MVTALHVNGTQSNTGKSQSIEHRDRKLRTYFMIIYKILRTEEFLELETSGSSDSSVVDRQDGFVHFSTKKQLSRTLEKHFYKENNLILMAIDSKTVLKN